LVHRAADDENEKTTVGMNLYAALERREELEERKRMLYVACTRAADYLILSSSLEAYDAPKSDWMKLLAERFNLEDVQLNSELPDGSEQPEIRVTTDPQTAFKPLGRSRGPELLKILEEAHQLAATGGAEVPPGVPSVPVDRSARRQFSFSRLTGD